MGFLDIFNKKKNEEGSNEGTTNEVTSEDFIELDEEIDNQLREESGEFNPEAELNGQQVLIVQATQGPSTNTYTSSTEPVVDGVFEVVSDQKPVRKERPKGIKLSATSVRTSSQSKPRPENLAVVTDPNLTYNQSESENLVEVKEVAPTPIEETVQVQEVVQEVVQEAVISEVEAPVQETVVETPTPIEDVVKPQESVHEEVAPTKEEVIDKEQVTAQEAWEGAEIISEPTGLHIPSVNYPMEAFVETQTQEDEEVTQYIYNPEAIKEETDNMTTQPVQENIPTELLVASVPTQPAPTTVVEQEVGQNASIQEKFSTPTASTIESLEPSTETAFSLLSLKDFSLNAFQEQFLKQRYEQFILGPSGRFENVTVHRYYDHIILQQDGKRSLSFSVWFKTEEGISYKETFEYDGITYAKFGATFEEEKEAHNYLAEYFQEEIQDSHVFLRGTLYIKC